MDSHHGLLTPEVLHRSEARELLASYEAILKELRKRQVIRTNDAPSGQYAEWLACSVLGGVLEPNATKSYDLITPDGVCLQIKARVLRPPTNAGQRQLSVFRSFDFDQALIILFDNEYQVHSATLMPQHLVFEHSRQRAHVNGRVLIATDAVLKQGSDITSKFREGVDQMPSVVPID